MKITVKNKESNAFEKRDTAILTFSLVSVIPLLICLVLGFLLGKTTNINHENMLRQLEAKNQELSILQARLDDTHKNIEELSSIFFNADTTMRRFKEVETKNLLDKLAAAQMEYEFMDWENDQKEAIDDFKHAISRIERPLTVENDTLQKLLTFSKSWLTQFAIAVSDELSNRKLIKKLNTGNSIQGDLQSELFDLKGQLTECKVALALASSPKNGQGGNDGTGEIQRLKTQIIETEKKVVASKEKADAIDKELSFIRENIVINMKGCRFFENRQDELAKLKDLLQSRVTNIQNHVNELK